MTYNPDATIAVLREAETVEVTALEVTQTMRDLVRARADALAYNNLVLKQRDRAEEVREYLLQNYDDIGSDHADHIADLLGIELTREVVVRYTVTFEVTVNLEAGEDIDDYAHGWTANLDGDGIESYDIVDEDWTVQD